MSVYKIDSIVTNLSPPYVGSYKKISAPSSDNVWMCGETRILHYTNNTFTEPTVPSGAYNDLHFINNLEGWVVGNNGLILYTNNGGASWDVQVNPSFNHLRSVFFLNANEGWTVGDNGRILHTTNGGTDWNIEASGLTSEFLTGVHFTSSINGYVVGEGETILKFGELTAVENEKDLVTGFSLSQNYPNPFNPITNIEFRIANFEFVSLKVYDVLGNEVAVLINEEKPAEKYEVEFNGNDLTSGIYFYQLRSGDYVQTKKMLLIK